MSTALVEWRKARSVELVLQGHTYDQVAEQVGYANRGTAWRTVPTALGAQKEQAGEERRPLPGVRWCAGIVSPAAVTVWLTVL